VDNVVVVAAAKEPVTPIFDHAIKSTSFVVMRS
jgi:hypothetical protein